MAEKKESFFWTSYSDLMTSLFFIMLTLFVLVIVLLHKRMEATEKQLDENIKAFVTLYVYVTGMCLNELKEKYDI